jgi:hypothetical protein
MLPKSIIHRLTSGSLVATRLQRWKPDEALSFVRNFLEKDDLYSRASAFLPIKILKYCASARTLRIRQSGRKSSPRWSNTERCC